MYRQMERAGSRPNLCLIHSAQEASSSERTVASPQAILATSFLTDRELTGSYCPCVRTCVCCAIKKEVGRPNKSMATDS